MVLLQRPFWLLGAAALLLWGCSGYTSSHSLHYFYTGVSEPSQGLPQFITAGYVDDQLFVQYDSDTSRVMPRVPWIEKAVVFDPQYWDTETQASRGNQRTFRENLMILQNRYNQSGGLHTLQFMYGCELSNDGRKRGYVLYGYDGRDFISFDQEILTWVAADIRAQLTKRKWDADLQIAQRWKTYLEGTCIEWLQKYLGYGNETLLRKESPTATISLKANDNGQETLFCQVYGFYPREIDATWRKDGEVWVEKTFRGTVSPNSDGTHYTWLSIEIDPREKNRFQCHVEHDTLLKPLDLTLEKSASILLWFIVGAMAMVLASTVLLVSGIACFIKK
ncbi:H-2 class I histocompatibility antigen, Q9 alpha chain-like [Hemicordylus capensis]|uniref:H-2 class I histocompatibility antigen, Q9 alpha chain-like n=1 Tax=Hemicordylus capensis TaxID=884348 RepID=UPI0023047429|nr:H-2 class I histocompatibility antigen, Q9 alpha chain-like [Hemicordylus capensis]